MVVYLLSVCVSTNWGNTLSLPQQQQQQLVHNSIFMVSLVH